MPSLIPNQVKLVIIGDGGVGKTSLLITYCCDKFPYNFVTVFDNYVKAVTIAEETYYIHLFDTGGV